MGAEIDLLKNYPRTPRDVNARLASKSEKSREIARRFDREFFDGEREFGYGGFSYNEKYWSPVLPDFDQHFGNLATKSILDVGCAKGFMLFDLLRLYPGAKVKGVDISDYAILHSIPEVRPFLQVANAKSLPFKDDEFDLVISINTIHNLNLKECKEALREISRVSRDQAFITVDAYRNEEERERMLAWNLTARTILSVEDWVTLFEEVGYKGDYFWFIP